MRRAVTVLGLVLVAVGLLSAPVPVQAAEADAATVTNAVLRWGMSNEANNAAHAPGTSNFFSAGKIPDPGKGSVKLPQSAWKQAVGNVAIEKWNGTAYAPATWAGLTTDSAGVAITSPSSGRYSGHQFVFSGGTGTLDRQAGTAHLSWTGDVTVLFYSGYTFFYLSDPVLDVVNGKATLTATASGFGTSQENPELWVALDPVTVTLATLPSVDLTSATGFNATPAYDGVKVTSAGQSYTGSFPQSFVDFLTGAGTAAFWFNSGSSTDAAKKALPLTVSYDAADPVAPAEPADPEPVDVPDNDAPEPPKTVTNTIVKTVRVPGSVVVPPPAPLAVQQPVAVDPAAASVPLQLLSAPVPAAARDSFVAGWWLGGAFLALAVLVLASALISPSLPSRRNG